MRTRLASTICIVLALLAMAASLTQAQAPLAEAGTAFTYQGRLVDAGSPANGPHDFIFTLWDALTAGRQIGAAITIDDHAVVDGLFTVPLDFGAVAFTGQARYLEVAVRPGPSTKDYTTLAPRQKLTATPYALYAFAAPWAGLLGVPAGLDDGDDDTTYTAGTGLTLVGTEFRVNTGVIQQRVTGACWPGSTVRGINADGTVVCQQDAPLLRALPPAANQIISLDTAIYAGDHQAATIGADGLPVIAYHDGSLFDLKVLHCGNLDCSVANQITTLDSAGAVGWYSAIAIGADGAPVIAYDQMGSHELKVAHCSGFTCAGGGNTITVVATGLADFRDPAITIGADGLPVIAYYDSHNDDLNVLHCGNAACNSGNNLVAPDSAGDVGQFASIALGHDGLPVVSYHDSTNSSLKVLHCGNATCTSGNTITAVDEDGDVGRYTSLAIGADGLPVIAYVYGAGQLKVLHCGDDTCSSGNTITTVDDSGTALFQGSITIGADGLPIISYYDGANDDLQVLHCGNMACSSGNVSHTVDSANDVGHYSSITIGVDGLPVIGYNDDTDHDLKVLRCANALCAPYLRRR